MPRVPAPPRGRLILLAALASLVAIAGCRTNRQDQYSKTNPEVLYSQAHKALLNQDFDNSIKMYEALTARYPFAPESRQARLDLIYAYYRGREAESAIDAADTFIRENPTHPRIDYAWYIKGLVDFERMPNRVERLFRVDLSERPPQTAAKAFASFKTVVEQYPKSEYAHDARRRMLYLRNRLADYEIYVARYYMKRGAWVAAAQRAEQTIEQYDGSPAVRDALAIMIDAYGRLGMKELADNTRAVYALNFPGDQKRVAEKKSWWKLW
ncbi:MAG TPA: outer membrane protein assembly factor BamD [Steroidobacteraceae bacterium]|nr:outer membrane protein assembly factor BamD [Steroidobacteraceae bacterium]HQZ81389.1 outer membrane protein assembly factor BamD [Steroidobacteraceae bacterium]